MKRVLIILGFLFVSSLTHGQSLKRMRKLLEKQEFEQLESVLNKSYQKDTLYPDALYMNAMLFLTKNFNKYNIDSAYSYFNSSFDDLKLSDEKTSTKLEKNGLNAQELESRLSQVEQLGFDRANEKNTLEDYQYFIDYFPAASQNPQAIEKRNRLAFERAKAENTYESFSNFLATYPNARQIKEAQELYDIRLFQEMTKSKSLSGYKNFITDYPESPFRNEAEKQVFEIITASNDPEDFIDFLNSIDHKFYTKKAVDYLYYSSQFSAEKLKSISRVPSSLEDSIANLTALYPAFLIPFFDISKFGFMDTKGRVVLPKNYNRIDQKYKCYGLEEDIIISESENGDRSIYGRNGSFILGGITGNIVEHGYGILEVEMGSKKLLIQKGGHMIRTGSWDEVKILAHSILAILYNGKWNLCTLSGRPLLDSGVNEINDFGSQLLIQINSEWAIIDNQSLSGSGLGLEPHLNPVFDEIEVEDEYLLAYKEDYMYLIDTLGNKLNRRGFLDIYNREDQWILKSDSSYEIAFDNSFQGVGPFDDVMYNDKFLLGEQEGFWGFIFPGDSLLFDLHDPKFLGSEFLIAQKSDSLMLFFHPDSTGIFLDHTLPELVRNTGTMSNKDQLEYILLETGKKKSLINSQGLTIDVKARYENFQIYGKEYIVVEYKGKKGLLNLEGRELLKPTYDGIGNYKEGYLALLSKGKFGLIHDSLNVMLSPKYDIAPIEIAPGLFMAKKEGVFGLIDNDEITLLDFEYDDMTSWSDSTIWVKKNFRWSLVNAYTLNRVLDDVKDYKILESKDELLFKVLTGTGYGILSNKRGEIVPPTYSDLHHFFNNGEYTYFCEKNIEEALFFVLIYIDHEGKIIKKQAFEEEDYLMIYCDQD